MDNLALPEAGGQMAFEQYPFPPTPGASYDNPEHLRWALQRLRVHVEKLHGTVPWFSWC